MNDHFWTAKDIGINSISGILTNSASNSNPFANLPQVPVCLIRRVKKEEFDPYLKSVNLDRFQYNQQMGVIEGTPQLGLTNNDPDIIRLEKLLYNKPLLKPDKHHSNNIPGIDTVPAYFFNQNFSTSDPETFLKVCENVDPSVTSSPEKVSLFQSQNTAQQEKLSHFLDTIEIHLIREISRRSTSFFSALSNLQTLSLETQSCVSQIQSLRDSIKNVEKIAFRNGLNIIQLKRRRGNVEGLYGAVRLISEIIQTQPTINTLVEEGDFVGALDLIGDSTKLLHGVSTQSDDSVTEMLTTNIKLVKYSSLVPKSLDLRGIKSLSNLNTKMGTVSKNIGDLMEAEFCNVLMNHIDSIIKLVPDVRQFEPSKRHEIVFPLENSPVVEFVRNLVLEKFSLGRLTTLNSSLIDTDLENRLNPIVLGLLRIDKLGNALSNYKEMLSAGIKTLSKMYYPASKVPYDDSPMSPSIESESSSLSRKLQQNSDLAKLIKSMSSDVFLDLIMATTTSLFYYLQTISTIHASITKLVQDAEKRGIVIGTQDTRYLETKKEAQTPAKQTKLSIKTNDDDDEEFGAVDFSNESQPEKNDDTGKRGASNYAQIILDSADVVYSVYDLAHMRCSKLISIRNEQNSQLSPKEFFRYFGCVFEFVSGCEVLNGRTCFGLKSTIQSQAKSFVLYFHEEKSKELALLIDNEQWTQSEVPNEFQNIMDRILVICSSPRASVESMNKEPSSAVDEDDEDADVTAMLRMSATRKQIESGVPVLVINNQKFYAVGCLLMFLKMLADYMTSIDNIPGLTNDILNRILEVLKLFNSRVCQVILGAGAMKSAGLKNITARHIALATQSLGVIIQIIPHLKTSISNRLPPKQLVLLTDFDRLLRDYREHQSELYSKLVMIMQERLTAHCKSLCSINWDSPDQKDFSAEESASTCMIMLVKETSTLHKVLAKYLSNDTLKAIMSDVFKAYSAKLEEEFKKLDLFSSAGKNRLLIDVQYYIEKLSALDGTDGPSNHMEVVVNNIKIKDKRAAMSSAQASTLAPRSSSELGSGSSGDVRRASIVGTPEKPIISPLPPKGSEAGKKFTNMFNYATPTKK